MFEIAIEGTFLWTDGSALGSGFTPNWASNQPATSGSSAAVNQVEESNLPQNLNGNDPKLATKTTGNNANL